MVNAVPFDKLSRCNNKMVDIINITKKLAIIICIITTILLAAKRNAVRQALCR